MASPPGELINLVNIENKAKQKDQLISAGLPKRLAASYSHRGNPPTTIGAEELNFRVRHGNGCDLFAIATKLCLQDEGTGRSSQEVRAFSRVSLPLAFESILSKLDNGQTFHKNI